MSSFVNDLTVSTVILGIIIICIILFIRRFFSREKRISTTFLFLIVLFGAGYLYLDQHDMAQMKLSEFAETIFPSDEPTSYNYDTQEGYQSGRPYTRYVFKQPMPRLKLAMDTTGKYFTMKDLKPLNRVLTYIGLQRVDEEKPELVAITGKSSDTYSYVWENYAGGGTLVVERTICDEDVELGTPHCLSSITIYR